MRPLQKSMNTALVALFLSAATTPALAQASEHTSFGGFIPPTGWMLPPLDPTGVELTPRKLAPGVYALLSTRPPVDNSGFIIGSRGVLVIDAHINARMAHKIQTAVRAVTDKPILYLINTNAHGDHTFGNYAFPKTTTIIAHRRTADAMRDFEEETRNLLPAVNGNREIFDGNRLRLPDVVFDKYMKIDLGDRMVELHHFGQGNTPGDTVVYSPDAKAAWTGNLVLGQDTIPWAIEGRSGLFLATLARLKQTLDIETLIPGHGVITTGEAVDFSLRYLSSQIEFVRRAIGAGWSLEQTLAQTTLSETFLPPKSSPLAMIRPLANGFHRWNVKKTYLEMTD